jgi:hypothetical protein
MMFFLAVMLDKIVRINDSATATQPEYRLLDPVDDRVNCAESTIL